MVIRNSLYISALLITLFLFPGCSLLKKGFSPALANISPNGDINAVKTGDVLPKSEIKASAQAPIGANNTATNVGGNLQTKEVNVNSSKVIEKDESHWYWICSFLIANIFALVGAILKLFNGYIKTLCHQIETLEKMVFDKREV